MKNLLKKLIFIAQFHFQNTDPDSESGFRIRIQPGNLNPNPPGSATLIFFIKILKLLMINHWYTYNPMYIQIHNYFQTET